MNPPTITETIREFIKEADSRNDSLFISRMKLQRYISNLNTSQKDEEFSNENELIVAIYVLLKSYQMYDKYSIWSKQTIHKYLKQQQEIDPNTDDDDIFRPIYIVQEILKKMFPLDIKDKTDEEIIHIINNTLFKTEKQIMQNLKELEKILKIDNTLLNANMNPQQIYETLQKRFEDKERNTNAASTESVTVAETLTPTIDKTTKSKKKIKIMQDKHGEKQKQSPIKRKNLSDSEEKKERSKDNEEDKNDTVTINEATKHQPSKKKRLTLEDLYYT